METLDLTSPLRTAFSLTYESTDISTDCAPDLLSLTYTDKIGDQADELQVTLKDETGKWAGSWTPERGAKVSAGLSTSAGSLSTGVMVIDELQANGGSSGRTVNFSAVSVPLDNTIRRTPKTRNFEALSLQTIASQIAGENGLTFAWDSSDDPTYDRVDQRQESDLAFIERLCQDAGLSVKIAAEKLTIFDQKSYESKTPIDSYTLGSSPILSWSFSAQQSERYKAVTVKWRNIAKKTKADGGTAAAQAQSRALMAAMLSDGDTPEIDINADPNAAPSTKKGKQKLKAEYIDFTYEDPTVESGGQTYVVRKRCTSQAEAERVAKATLRRLNLRQLTGSLRVVGNPNLYAGAVLALAGFGSFDGNFIIEQAVHSLSAGGYTTALSLRRVNIDY